MRNAVVRHDLDGKATMTGIDSFQARALEIIASGKVRDAFDHLHQLIDPSHVRALSLEELTGLSHDAGLRDLKTVSVTAKGRPIGFKLQSVEA
jgi:hypothetical protein